MKNPLAKILTGAVATGKLGNLPLISFEQLPGVPTDEWIVTDIRGSQFEITRAGTMLDRDGNAAIDDDHRLSISTPHDVVKIRCSHDKIDVGHRLEVETLQPSHYPDRRAFRAAIIDRVAAAIMRLPELPTQEPIATRRRTFKPRRSPLALRKPES